MHVNDTMSIRRKWIIRRYADDGAFAADQPYDVSEIDGNLLLNEGIGEMLDLLIGVGSPTTFSNANARLGVGDSSTAESAAQTDLQAATNKTYKAMAASYPSRTAQTVTWRAVFGGTDANYAWAEFCVDNGSWPSATMRRNASRARSSRSPPRPSRWMALTKNVASTSSALSASRIASVMSMGPSSKVR